VALREKVWLRLLWKIKANILDEFVFVVLLMLLLIAFSPAVQPSHLDYYLDEFTFRFNRRTSCLRGGLFYRLLEQAVIIPPVTGQDIRGGRMIF
jgi:hypothetical protein